MQTYRARITPLSAFGTVLKGDTLFGQLCWAVRNRYGESQLISLLEGYTGGRPFAVISDALPTNHLPRPVLPGQYFNDVPGMDRKALKKRSWLPLDHFHQPMAQWLVHCKSSGEVPGGVATAHPQPHNTLNRLTGTTGEGPFAPYTLNQVWYGGYKSKTKVVLDLYLVVDESRLTVEQLSELLTDIGTLGFGRDASIGLGKFRLFEEITSCEWPKHANANAWMTLAPCAPQKLAWKKEGCFYTTFTRFGRHGDLGAEIRTGIGGA
jgi:CRISPR-associated protein Csm4